MIRHLIRPEIQRLQRVTDTFEDRFDYLRLDKNEHLKPFDQQLFEHFKSTITSEDITAYPELGPLYRKLSHILAVNKDQLFLSAGSDMAIRSIYLSCIERGDNVVVPFPCYAMYNVYAHMFGANDKRVSLTRDWLPDIDVMLGHVNKRTKIFVLENPSGTVGLSPTIEQIQYCASKLCQMQVILLIDEVYIFIEKQISEAIRLIDHYPNVIIVQSFSKSHGLAGVRLGYLIGNAELIQYISRVRPMHEIGSLTESAALWVLDHPEILLDYQRSITESKDFLKNELIRLNILYKDTSANFMMLYLPDECVAGNIRTRIKGHNILIREAFSAPSCLKGWIRITVGSLSDCKRFIEALTSVLRPYKL